MLASAYLLLAALGQPPSDQLQRLAGREALELSWADAEDRIQGSIRPLEPRAGEPLEVSVNVGTFEGKPFDGPVTLSLRQEGQEQGEERTVTRGRVNWNATFTPAEPGAYVLDVAFRSTRLKVTHAPLEVRLAKLSRWPWWVMLGLASGGALVFGVRSLLPQRKRAPPG